MEYENLKRGYEMQKEFLDGINTLIQFEEDKTAKGEANNDENPVTKEEIENLKVFMKVQSQAVDTIVKLFNRNADSFKKLEEEHQKKIQKETEQKKETLKSKKPEEIKKENAEKAKKAMVETESLFNFEY